MKIRTLGIVVLFLLLTVPCQAILLLDGNVPPGCTNVAGELTCTSFTGDGSGLTGIDGNETQINRLITAGTAAKALALNANGSNCSAGYSPLGVDAAGAVESCWQVTPAAIGAIATGGNAGTASALAANGANCSSGQAPLGVDASGAVEGCFAVLPLTGGTLTGALTLDDGDGASPALHFIDATNEDVYFYKVDAGYFALYVNDTDGGLYVAGGNLQVGNVVSDPPTQTQDGNDAYISGNAEIKGQIWGGAGAFNVDADGDVTAKSYSTTRTNTAQYVELFEAQGGGDGKVVITADSITDNGTTTITFGNQDLNFSDGTFTDGKYCTYASSGAVISCNSTPAGAGDFLADGSVPMTGGLVLADGNGAAPTTDGAMKYDRTTEKLQVGDGAATKSIIPEGIASGGVILGDDSPDAAGELGYASNQLSVHDGTASRSLLQVASTTITKYQYLPSGWMVDAAASPCAANAAISGEETMARLCDDNESVIVHWQVDPEWTAGVKFRVYYALVSDASADNTVSWRVQGCSVGNSEALTCSAGDLVSVDDELGTDDDANQVMISDWSAAVTLTGIAAGEFARMILLRGTDDYAAEVNLLGIELKYQAKVSASSDY